MALFSILVKVGNRVRFTVLFTTTPLQAYLC